MENIKKVFLDALDKFPEYNKPFKCKSEGWLFEVEFLNSNYSLMLFEKPNETRFYISTDNFRTEKCIADGVTDKIVYRSYPELGFDEFIIMNNGVKLFCLVCWKE